MKPIGENMDKQDKDYIWSKFKKTSIDSDLRTRNEQKKGNNIGFDQSTGLDNETIKENVLKLAEELKGLPHQVVKARAFEYVTENVRIDVSPHDWFVTFGCWDRNDRPLSPLMNKWSTEVDNNILKTGKLLNKQNHTGAAAMWTDFDHSVPDWDVILALGFPGLRERARRHRSKHEASGELSYEGKAYFDGIEITYTAILKMLERFRTYALEHEQSNERVTAVAKCLDTLINGAPANTYEVLQLIYLYFMFSEYIDRFQVRSLGNIDRIIYPYYVQDLKDGRYTENQIRDFFDYFLMQWASIDNYWGQPVYFGGTRKDGETEINELSYLILEEYDKLGIYTPKVQLKIAQNTPQKFLNMTCDMIRRGHSSLVFISEESVRRSLMGIGANQEEARTCDIWGCYEFTPKGNGNCTAPAYINVLKPIELIFNNGVDPSSGIDLGRHTGVLDTFKTFDDFYSAYLKQLDSIIENVISCTNDFEQYLSFISPAQMFSATVENSLKTMRDAFHNGCDYNPTMILHAGFATAIDALMAIKKFVYEKNELTLVQFKEILNDNWNGHERLRLKILHDKNKFGNGIESVDLYAEAIARFIANKINLRPNGRNGFYIASLHSARTFISLGQKTGATPDGRFAGEEISKNTSPTMGMDINGVTAMIKSVTRIDTAQFLDFPLDVMMHPATVQGENGLTAMRTLLETYFEKHGIAIHFNIFDAETLLDAQAHPDKYQGLQVRVCGWNVNFTELSRKEQDMFIRRARNISE
ncbi:MAG: hypothetical protein JXR78_14045 [Victivallales bacterium]|nr:hypothetical protein [Victivallales bacterium]